MAELLTKSTYVRMNNSLEGEPAHVLKELQINVRVSGIEWLTRVSWLRPLSKGSASSTSKDLPYHSLANVASSMNSLIDCSGRRFFGYVA